MLTRSDGKRHNTSLQHTKKRKTTLAFRKTTETDGQRQGSLELSSKAEIHVGKQSIRSTDRTAVSMSNLVSTAPHQCTTKRTPDTMSSETGLCLMAENLMLQLSGKLVACKGKGIDGEGTGEPGVGVVVP